MLKLFYSPGACSLVSHIALEEAGADFEAVRVTLAKGEHLLPDYLAINPHARVPALGTDRGTITESIAVINFIADCFRSAGCVPRDDPFIAARCNELLSWFATTVHISFATVWRGSRFSDDESIWPVLEAGGRKALEQHFVEIDSLCGEGWLINDLFSAADSYALTFFRWGRRIGFDMSRYPRWAALVGRALDRPAVAAAIQREGLKAEEFRAA